MALGADLEPEVPVKRMVFHEITKDAIKASLGNTRNVDEDMVDAQETRRILDRLYGYELSPVLWRKVGPGLSAGRVQSVATRLIVERERERMAFVRASYWDVTAVLGATDAEGEPASFESRMVSLGGKRLAGSKDFSDDGKLAPSGFADNVCQLDEAHANALAKLLADATFTVASMETKPYRRRPLPAVHHIHAAADGRQPPVHELTSDHACRAGAVRERLHHVYANRFGDLVAGGHRRRP